MKKKVGPKTFTNTTQTNNIKEVPKVQVKKQIQVKVPQKVEQKTAQTLQKLEAKPTQKIEVKKIQNIKKIQSKPVNKPVNKPANKIQIKKVQQVKTQKPIMINKQVPVKNAIQPFKKIVNPSIELIKPVQQNKKIVAVIISFKQGASYDHLFTSVQQKAQEGTQVLVYACQSRAAAAIVQAFKKQTENEKIKKMLQHINSVDPDCVVFNWECCSVYGDKKFAAQGKTCVFQLLQIIINKGYMAMFSDFSLKALIAQWDQKILGPNPFVNTSQFYGHIQLFFDCQKLKDCASAQLQVVGDMAVEGHCNVQTMPSTIVYGIDMNKTQTDIYKLDILTIVTNIQNTSKFSCQLNGKKGMAGHVSLTYKSGAILLTSMGHWIQLMKIDTSEKVLFEVAERQFGTQKAKSMKMEYESLDEVSKKQFISRNAVQFVKSSAPCKNMSKKAKKMY